jgi:hypothetical protein
MCCSLPESFNGQIALSSIFLSDALRTVNRQQEEAKTLFKSTRQATKRFASDCALQVVSSCLLQWWKSSTFLLSCIPLLISKTIGKLMPQWNLKSVGSHPGAWEYSLNNMNIEYVARCLTRILQRDRESDHPDAHATIQSIEAAMKPLGIEISPI